MECVCLHMHICCVYTFVSVDLIGASESVSVYTCICVDVSGA